MFRQLDIYWVDLNPTKGSETQKNRPCIILQADDVNHGSKTLVVAPILPNHKQWPFAVNVKPTDKNGIDKDRHLNIKQLRAVDASRIGKKLGRLESRYLEGIHNALVIVFGK